MYNNFPEQFEVPVLHAVQRPKLLCGAPRLWTIWVFIGAAIAFIWHAWPVIPLALILHAFAVWGTRQDAQWFSIIIRCFHYKNYYRG